MSRMLDDIEQAAFLDRWEKMQDEIAQVRTDHKAGKIGLRDMYAQIREIRAKYRETTG